MSISHALLVEPPSVPSALESPELSSDATEVFSPPWSSLCLRAYLLKHTRHSCTFLDLRLADNVEAQLTEAVAALDEPRVVVVRTSSLALGPALGVLEMAKRCDSDIVTVAFGQHPSQFPGECAALPRMDYGLCGDPEPILRNLLDYMDLAQRLRRIPGLIHGGRPTLAGDEPTYVPPRPSWLPHLRSVTPPDWSGVFWQGYQVGVGHAMCRAEIRLSRGTAKSPACAFFGQSYEPLREWPTERLAPLLDKSSRAGITEVVVTDPPSLWTEDRLNRWLDDLSRAHNSQNWSISLLPALLPDEIIERLEYTECRSVRFVVPTPDLKAMRALWAPFTWEELKDCFERLEGAGIKPNLEFWLGGPQEERGHDHVIVEALSAMGNCRYTLRPFPFDFDMPLYAEVADRMEVPRLDDWRAWARNPWTTPTPIPLWHGPSQVKPLQRRMNSITRKIDHSPLRRIRRVADWINPAGWIQGIERRVTGHIRPN